MKNVKRTAFLLVLGLLGGCAGTTKIKQVGQAEKYVGPVTQTPCGWDGRNVLKIEHARIETYRHKTTGLQFEIKIVDSTEDRPCEPIPLPGGYQNQTSSAAVAPIPPDVQEMLNHPGGRIRKEGEKLNNEKQPEIPK